MSQEHNHVAKQRKEYQAPFFAIHETTLHFTLNPTETLVEAILRCEKKDPRQKDMILEGAGLELLSINREKGTYQYDGYQLTLFDVPDQFELKTKVKINPKENKELMGLYRSRTLYCTQCEAEGFRQITFFLDRPDVLSLFKTKITASKADCPVLLSNGNRIAHTEDGELHTVEWQDPFPKPCYLFALVAGPLQCIHDTYQTLSGKKVDIEFYVEEADIQKVGHGVACLKRAMRWDEEAYGREYDLNTYMIVAVSDFNMGAMENKGLNVFNTKYVLADNNIATDADYEAIESVIGHEYFHNWSGNRVTCRDWFQLSLKEGLTVFREQQFTMAMSSSAACRIQDVLLLRTKQFTEDAGPLAHPVRPESYIEINNFYTMTVYEKGAEVIRMLFTILGPEKFRQAMDLYFKRHDGQAVTVDDYLACMQSVTDIDLSSFALWYSQAGTPLLTIQSNYLKEKQELHLSFQQSCKPTPGQPDKRPLLIPLVVALLSSEGKVVYEDTLLLTKENEQVVIPHIVEKPVLSFLGDFSAPIHCSYPYQKSDLAFLACHSPYAFNRWDCITQLMTEAIWEQVEDIEQPVSRELMDTFTRILNQSTDDERVLAKMLTIPTLVYLISGRKGVTIERVAAARDKVRISLGNSARALLLGHYEQSTRLGKEQTPKGRAHRALKASCLDYLVRLGKDYISIAKEQFQQAHNMSDRLSALFSLSDSHPEAAEPLLEQFFRQFEHEALVVDKWLSVQAVSEHLDTVERVRKLLKHPAFNLENPNKVYALLRSFSELNILAFHKKDGSGHQLLADCILEIDKKNSIVAARLAGAFNTWKQFNQTTQLSIEKQLHRLQEAPLSRGTYEIVSKALHAS